MPSECGVYGSRMRVTQEGGLVSHRNRKEGGQVGTVPPCAIRPSMKNDNRGGARPSANQLNCEMACVKIVGRGGGVGVSLGWWGGGRGKVGQRVAGGGRPCMVPA